MNNFIHILLTRFNTVVDYAPSTRRLDADWLTARLALFEQYCLPSIMGQRGAEFRWLVFFDAASPAWFKEKIASFAPLVEPVYLNGPATDEVIADSVLKTGIVTSPYLITTRLDNDDAISMDHLATVQRAFRSQPREFVTFPFGLQSLHGHLYNVCWTSNPFLSLIEQVGDLGQFTTVFCVPHDHVARVHRIRKLFTAPQWLQVLHNSNIGNALRGWPRLSSRSHRRFSVKWPREHRDDTDSVGIRLRFSVGAYTARAERLMRKLVTS